MSAISSISFSSTWSPQPGRLNWIPMYRVTQLRSTTGFSLISTWLVRAARICWYVEQRFDLSTKVVKSSKFSTFPGLPKPTGINTAPVDNLRNRLYGFLSLPLSELLLYVTKIKFSLKSNINLILMPVIPTKHVFINTTTTNIPHLDLIFKKRKKKPQRCRFDLF